MEAAVLLWIQDHVRNPILTPVMSVITTLGDKGILWIALTLLLLGTALFVHRAGKLTGKTDNPYLLPAVTCLISILLTFLLGNILLKNLVARTRPYEVIQDLVLITKKPHDYSFPSGHTSVSFAFASALLFVLPKEQRWIGIITAVLAALIGFSRLYLGVHYPTDVLGGLVLGCVCGWAASLITKKTIGKR